MKIGMKSKRRGAASEPPFAFWDSSAIVPLCGSQRQSAQTRQLARSYRLVVWWGTSIEVTSALHRLKRESTLSPAEVLQSIARLDALRTRWDEVTPSDSIRELAERLLGLHKLRGADSLQLASALDWCANRTRGRAFICGDGDLLVAAEAESFTCFRIH
jgi:predicted nucleic acid-binding protein